MIKRKFADKREIKNIIGATYKKINIADDQNFVAATIVDINEVDEKLTITRQSGREDTIADVAYKWLTLFVKDEHFAIEVVFNAKSEIVQFVFDIVKKANYKTYVPYKLDLYLDVAITSRKEIEFIDEDKLENAYKMGEISRKNYELAKKTADRIVNRYSRQDELIKLINDSQKYLARLMAFNESREIVKKQKSGGFEIEGMKELFGKGEAAENTPDPRMFERKKPFKLKIPFLSIFKDDTPTSVEEFNAQMEEEEKKKKM